LSCFQSSVFAFLGYDYQFGFLQPAMSSITLGSRPGLPTARLLMAGALAVALWFGGIGIYTQPAHAAGHSAYEAGPIRQSRNPVSGENFHGGVEPSAFDQRNNPDPTPEGQAKGFLESAKDAVKDVLPGTSADNPDFSNRAPADLNTSKNPTLKRYGADEQ
jgi:hypothetical protein